MKILIVTALTNEHEVILNYFYGQKTRGHEKKITIKIFNETNNEFNLVQLLNLDGVGNVLAGIKVTRAILEFRPNVIIQTGILGGFKKNSILKLGDIILANKVVYYEYAKLERNTLSRRFKIIDIPEKITSLVLNCFDSYNKVVHPNTLNDEINPTIHIGTILSGEKIIADDSFGEELKKQLDQILGTEMESYGLLLSAKELNNKIHSIILKVVGDWAGDNKNDDWHEYSFNISASMIMYLLKFLNFEELNKIKT